MKAFSQSSGYANQALNAIKVVSAFGQEEKEHVLFSKFLGRARTAGIKQWVKIAAAFGFFFCSIFLSYCYSFYMGMVYIVNDIRDSPGDEPYTGGDVLLCFFGMLMGFFSIGMAAPNMKAVAEGKVAGKLAFDIIDRKPKIQSIAGAQKTFTEGTFTFKGVSFTYPSRPDQMILQSFSATIKAGQTTALVGPSGSGKSTIVQMVERFYDPDQGTVELDGKDLKNYDLEEMRK